MEENSNNKLTIESYKKYCDEKVEFRRLEKKRLKSDFVDLIEYYPDLVDYIRKNKKYEDDGQYFIFICNFSAAEDKIQDLFLRTNDGEEFLLFWRNCTEYDVLVSHEFLLAIYDLKNHKRFYQS